MKIKIKIKYKLKLICKRSAENVGFSVCKKTTFFKANQDFFPNRRANHALILAKNPILGGPASPWDLANSSSND